MLNLRQKRVLYVDKKTAEFGLVWPVQSHVIRPEASGA